MPMLTYLQSKGLSLTADWQAYILIGLAAVLVIALIIVIVKARKW